MLIQGSLTQTPYTGKSNGSEQGTGGKSTSFLERTRALTAVLVILEDFAHVAGVHESKELSEEKWSEITGWLLLKADSLLTTGIRVPFHKHILAED